MSRLNVTSFLAEGKFTPFHFWMLFWACVIITFDMYDLVIFGSVLPVLMTDWGITPAQAGLVGSSGLFGMMVGAMVFGLLADRFGRRNILIASIVMFSVATVLCAVAPGPAVFGGLRFIAGLGIGGILPTIIAMLTDYAPKRLANTFVAIVMSFFSVGGILAALVAMVVIPRFGWQATYYVAAIPLLLLPLMLPYFADSPAVLLATGRGNRLHAILERIAPGKVSPVTELVAVSEAPVDAAAVKRSPLAALFTDGRALATLMVWVAFFMCLLMVNGLNTWLPGLMVNAGYALTAGLTFMATMNIGAIIGTLTLGRLADKLGVKKVLVPMFLVAGISIIALGYGNSFAMLIALVFIAGACTMGAQNISYAFVSQYYPSHIRSTAIGMASGIGRLGAIGGPTFGGLLLSMGVSSQMNFLFFAIPGFIAAAAFLLVPLGRRQAPSAPATPDVNTPAPTTV
ncbi:aromatic acid/H+ symport family MFS transporter [Corynebacterium sp. YIM 101645]|uniref:Aromatic acid/H+ symport family MFS transporter n=1 Tax=Corynebacterium lemuris TaxID=1859292 RepID=A0ABT2FUC5_9CORY|nr:aromatic acid/H+ symport family MFS transporter [Corynebacterium lemuris]MCS5478829.1 aromatic acid/H+ symport family MFS transporter [Corynebacterium lemuris]